MKWLVAHWELKLVSFVLAVALWLYTSGQVRVERTLEVRFAPERIILPEGCEFVSVSPALFKLVVSVPVGRDQEDTLLQGLEPRLTVLVGSKWTGKAEFPIANRVLGLTSDVRILRTEPEQIGPITVVYDRRQVARLPVEPPKLTGIPDGWEATLRLDLTQVQVKAGSQALDRLRSASARIPFEEIDLSRTDARRVDAHEERFTLRPRKADYDVIDAVTATIALAPIPEARQVAGVPVHILTPRDFPARLKVEIDPALATLTLRGPAQQLRTLKPDDEITAFVNLTGTIEPGTVRELPVKLLAPAWLAADAVKVRVKVSENPSPAASQPSAPTPAVIVPTVPAPGPAEAPRPPAAP